MSAATTATNDLLRLTQCPRCDYSLQGLPAEGICPECGTRYDQSAIVLRGRLAFGQRANRPGIPSLIWLAVWFALVFLPYGRFRGDPLMLFVMGYMVLASGLTWADRLLSPRGDQVLLWINARGLAQQNDFDPTAATTRLRGVLPIFYALGLFVVLGFQAYGKHEWVSSAVIAGIAALIVLVLLITRRRRLFGAEVHPALIAWPQFHRLQLAHLRGDRYRIRGEMGNWFLRRRPIDFEFTAPHEMIEQLAVQVRQWGSAAKLEGWWAK
jgi:hypothetical protein